MTCRGVRIARFGELHKIAQAHKGSSHAGFPTQNRIRAAGGKWQQDHGENCRDDSHRIDLLPKPHERRADGRGRFGDQSDLC